MGDKVKIAAVQIDPEITKNKENLDKILFEAEVAANNGADLIVFPECALAGYVYSSREEALPFAESIPGPSTDQLVTRCKTLGVYIVIGLLEKNADKFYNAAVLVGPEGIVGKYRKNHLPFLGVDRFVDRGDKPFKVYKTQVGNIGLHICYDCNFPESARVMMLMGADILVLPTNWPAGREKVPAYMVNTRAHENRVHFVAVDRVGSERGASFIGRSKIISAMGDTLAEASGDKEETIYGEISLAESRQKHTVFSAGEFEIDNVRDRRPELYGEITRRRD